MGIFRQFPYTNFHELNLDEIIKIMREMQDEWESTKSEWASYKDFIDNYFENLDVSDEVLRAMRIMVSDGTLNMILDPVLTATITDWLDDHITPGSPAIDKSLTIEDAAADAKAAGDAIRTVQSEISNFNADTQPVIVIAWESGGIDGNTGADAPAANRIRTGYFTTSEHYIRFFDAEATALYNIDIHKYAMDDTYQGASYNYPIYNGAVIGYDFDPTYKYRLVSPEVTHIPSIAEIPSTDNNVYLGCGAISAGTFLKAATNVATIRMFSVDKPSILVVNNPNCNIDLYYYFNGNYINTLSYTDTGNNIAYFPLDPSHTYRIYIQHTGADHAAMNCEIVETTTPALYNGGMYNGTLIYSAGNKRTNMINRNNYNYVKIWCSLTVTISKYKDGVFTASESCYSSVWSPAVKYVGDCDQFIIHSNGLADIRYELSNEERLCNLKWCSYGDSITAQQLWQNYLVARFGLVLSNAGLGGSCVTGNTASSITPMTDDGRINAIDADTDIITVMGGTNDFDYCTDIGSVTDLQTSYDDTTFIGSVAIIVKKLQAHCPNAKIILMSNPNTRGDTGVNSEKQKVSAYGYTPYDFAIAMKEAAEWLSVDYIDTWSSGINQLNRATYVADSVHPNSAGGKLIGLKAMQYFKTMDF